MDNSETLYVNIPFLVPQLYFNELTFLVRLLYYHLTFEWSNLHNTLITCRYGSDCKDVEPVRLSQTSCLIARTQRSHILPVHSPRGEQSVQHLYR